VILQVVGSASPDAAQETVTADSEMADLAPSYEVQPGAGRCWTGLLFQAGDGFICDPTAWREGLEIYPTTYITN
jgi:hypothetical protein